MNEGLPSLNYKFEQALQNIVQINQLFIKRETGY